MLNFEIMKLCEIIKLCGSMQLSEIKKIHTIFSFFDWTTFDMQNEKDYFYH